MPTANELAAKLVDGVLAPPDTRSQRIAVILNGLGRTKYEELFVVWGGSPGSCATGVRHRRAGSRRAGHQSRYGGLFADRDVAG